MFQTKSIQPIYGRGNVIGFVILATVTMMMAVFWRVTPCSLAHIYRRFRATCYVCDCQIEKLLLKKTGT
jgi:hypothetical protein